MSTESSTPAPARKVLPWLAVAVWAGLIFFFSAQPSLSTGLGVWDFIVRKAAHMFVFGILALLIWRATRQHGVSDRRAVPLAGLLGIIYAFSDEYHQSFVFGRGASLRDVGIDSAGIVLAFAIVFMAGRRRH